MITGYAWVFLQIHFHGCELEIEHYCFGLIKSEQDYSYNSSKHEKHEFFFDRENKK